MELKQKNRKPILSISLLSSGRKETIWKCLNSLKPIMEQISSELIIVDTGCDEETHKKMKEYTEQIIKFTWCNDFSKARNAGLKEACGEWFMFIDDDEWFSDVTELIQFFKSGEYKEYGHALYIQRNYRNEEGGLYKDSWVSRLIRLEKDTRFESPIHEYLYPPRGKCKLLHCPVEHYGYIFKTKEAMYEHSKRNGTLLEKQVEENPENIRGWTHLIQEYRGLKEYSKLMDCCKKALEVFKKQNHPVVNCSLGTFYSGMIYSLKERFRRKEALEFLKEALQDERITDITRARLYSFGAELSYILGEYTECIDYCKKYLCIYHEYFEKEEEILSQGCFFTYEAFEKEVLNNCYCFYIGATLKKDDFTILEKYFSELGFEKDIISLFSTFIEDVIKAFGRLEHPEKYICYLQTMLDRKGVDGDIFSVVKKIEKESEKSFKNLCRLFAEAESKYYYVWYMKIRNWGYAPDEKTKDKVYEYYRKLFHGVANIFQLNQSIFEIAIENDINLEDLFLEIEFEQWKAGTDYFCKEASLDRILKQKEEVLVLCKTSNIRFDYLYMKIAEREFLECEEETFERIQEKMFDFSVKNIEFYSQFYKSSVFRGEMEMLPNVCKLAVKLQKALKLSEQGNIKEAGIYFKECIKIYPPMETILKKYILLYKEERKKQSEQGEMIHQEIKELAVEIKEKIRVFLEKGMYQQAKMILEQLKELLPGDEELKNLELLVRDKKV